MNKKVINSRKSTSGISLVALVVTIIVLIILTGAVVVTFMEGGVIDKSKDAVKKSDSATLQEAYNIAYNTAKIDEVTGTGEKVDKIKILEKTVSELGLKGFEFDVLNQEVKYSGDNSEIEKWINNEFVFAELSKAGHKVYTIEGKRYMTLKGKTTNDDVEFIKIYGIADELRALGYELEGEYVDYKEDIDGDGIEDGPFVTTGTKLIKDGEVCATIVVVGDPNGDFCIDGGDFAEIWSSDSPETTPEKLLASDINNDGYVSQDDVYYFIRTGGFGGYFVAEIQDTLSKDKVPQGLGSKQLYTWHTSTTIRNSLTNTDKYEFEHKVNESNMVKFNLTLNETVTYAEFENDIKEMLGISQASIKVADKTAEVKVGDVINVNIPYELGKDIYSEVETIQFTVK